MNIYKITTLALTLATLGLTGCMGTKSLSQNISDEGRTSSADDIVFPALDKAWQKEGQFPNSENLSKIRAGIAKDELYQLIGRPHFSEANKAREWDYIMKFYQADDSVKICQYKVIFDKEYKGQEFHWLPADCANLAVQQPKTSTTVVSALAPIVPVVSTPKQVQEAQPEKEKFELGADALFDFNKWQLNHMKPEGKAKLDEVAEKILAYGINVNQIIITGHTDHLGDDMYNMNLSLLRAQTVRQYLIGKGIDANTMLATGSGETTPVKECSAKLSRQAMIDCLQPNRRVEIALTYFK